MRSGGWEGTADGSSPCPKGGRDGAVIEPFPILIDLISREREGCDVAGKVWYRGEGVGIKIRPDPEQY